MIIRVRVATSVDLIVAAAVGTLVESALWTWLAHGGRFDLFLLGHVIVLVLAGTWIAQPRRRHTRYGMLLWLSLAAFGPIGGLGVLWAMAVERVHRPSAVSIDTWHATLFPPGNPRGLDTSWHLTHAHSRPAHQADIASFQDLLTFGSVEERQATIAIIAQQFDPAFAPALRSAPADEHNVIRVQAATAIARLERQYFERGLTLMAALDMAPDDPDAVLALASHHDDQAFAGIFDAARATDSRTQAAELYERYLRLRPHDAEVLFKLARLFLRAGRAEDAEPRFRHLVDIGHPTARVWLMESLFAQRRFGEVRLAAMSWSESAALEWMPEAHAAVVFWRNPGAAA